MRILLINHYAGSSKHGMIFRSFYLAREWVRLGHEVTIAAASFSHVRSANPSANGAVTEEFIEGVRYLWLKTPSYRKNDLRRATNIASFLMRLLLISGHLAKRFTPDLVIASSLYVMDIFPAHRIARTTGARLAFNLGDLYPLTPMEVGGMSRRHPFIMALQLAEDFACRNADTIVSVLPLALPYLASRGLTADRFAYVPNGVDPTEWQDTGGSLPELHERELGRLRSQGGFIVGFTGNHGEAADLDTLIDAAALLRNTEVVFTLVGGGQQKARLETRAAAEGISNVLFLPPVPKAAVPQLNAAMDVLWIGLKAHPLFRFGVCPNKLLDYMMSAKPVISAIEAGNDMVAESGCGLSISPGSAERLVEAVRRLMSMSADERARMGRRGRDYVLKNHDYRVLARCFLEATMGRS
jgi:glycosyltransferase involved in cell wall biosynthesis